MCAIAVGLLAGLFATAVMLGMGDQIVSVSLTTRLSHVQITHPDYRRERDLSLYVPNAMGIASEITTMEQVRAAAPRMLVDAMASSPRMAMGVEMLGVIPSMERNLTIIDESIIEGQYFDTAMLNPAVIGQELAERLDIGVGSRLVLTFQNVEGVISGGAFRVSGLFRTPSAEFDRSTIYVRSDDLAPHLEMDQQRFQQVSILFTTMEAMDTSMVYIEQMAEGMCVETWRDLAPELDYIASTLDVFLYIFLIVILLALAFGIVNTMLMVVLERTREIGMLMAVGMKRGTLFSMIVLETVVLSVTGAVVGMVFSFVLISVVSETGIDLSVFAEGLAEFGTGEILYPQLPWTMYPVLGLMVIVVAVLSALYPALKALRLRPADALRTD
ncbi:FtsX-like permease family protein [Chitinispirillales bacterium ANBcel5]|uniref:ABC transporter permease n=1 Tax=Cellulosispirillum alkaliphilum TaxID=3039283 RepID=UPI002A50A525|nr:FtsX-like permease family protein [Chitinispirillales bacterium ANBcel5]